MIPGRKFTNQIHFLERPDFYQLFIPAYLRMTFKKITQINIQQSNASMIATIILTLYCKGLPQTLKNDLMAKMVLTIGEQHIMLNQNENKTKMSQIPLQHTITFTYRDVFKLQMSNSMFLVPFDIQNLSLKIYLRTLEGSEKIGGKKVISRFNLMNHKNQILKFSVSKLDDMGQFGLVGNMLKVSYVNQMNPQDLVKQTKQDKLTKPHPFHLAIFNFGIYRYPANTLLMIFIPLWLLTLINLAIFYQNNQIKNRISNTATLMVAYIAFLPTIRSKIPPSPNITFIEIITYILFSTSILCLIQCLIISRKQSAYVFIWYKSITFMACLAITLISFFVIAFLIIIHKTIWEPGYLRLPPGSLVPFRSKQWENMESDMYFADMRPNLRPISELTI